MIFKREENGPEVRFFSVSTILCSGIVFDPIISVRQNMLHFSIEAQGGDRVLGTNVPFDTRHT